MAAPAKKGALPVPVRGGWKRRWARRLAMVLGLLLVLPALEVGCVRFVDPPATPLMGIRWVQDRLAGEAHPRVRYHWLPWSELPSLFLKSAWVSEDQRFFQHHGFDWTEMHAAIAKAERTGGDPRGSSTITMQCARSTFLWQGHSYVRKALEAYYTVWMELLLSKRRIFELYANVVEMGPGVYGVEAASQYHYNQPARRLDAGEAAFLAALLPAPRKWNPRAPSPRLRARQERILRELPTARWPE
ncbi:MAG: monofunctional biosynthetic peptidoglycan transglycosylase [Gluconacetobacter diazotrophicus]|nr:monofunctional biosynthetic peptidoglycan transglycosylase [Gluconacetobacter diazotrophicus]